MTNRQRLLINLCTQLAPVMAANPDEQDPAYAAYMQARMIIAVIEAEDSGIAAIIDDAE